MTETNTNREGEDRGRVAAMSGAATRAAATAVAAALPAERRMETLLWAIAAAGVMLALFFLDAGTALAQAGGDVDTCKGDTGGSGGQQILDAGKKLVSYGGLLVGVVVAGGMLGAGMMTAGGSISEVWQKRGSRAAAAVLIGGLIALGGSAFFSLLEWAMCGGG